MLEHRHREILSLNLKTLVNRVHDLKTIFILKKGNGAVDAFL